MPPESVAAQLAKLTLVVEECTRMTRANNVLLNGEPSDPKDAGIKGELIAMRKREESRQWFGRTVLAGLLGAILVALVANFAAIVHGFQTLQTLGK